MSGVRRSTIQSGDQIFVMPVRPFRAPDFAAISRNRHGLGGQGEFRGCGRLPPRSGVRCSSTTYDETFDPFRQRGRSMLKVSLAVGRNPSCLWW